MKKVSLIALALLLQVTAIQAQKMALVRENDKFGYIDTSGNMVIAPQFDKAGDFSEGMAPALQDDKWGYIDTSGKWVLQPTYDRVKGFNAGYALVLKDDQWNYIDKSGTVLQTPVQEKYYDFNEYGVAFYRVDKKIGLIDTNGKVILEPTYEVMKPFVNGQARVRQGDLWGMIDAAGKITIHVSYNELSDNSGKAVWGAKGESFGVITSNGFEIVENADKIWDFTDNSNLTYARSDKKIGFINTKGEWVIPPTFDKARAFNSGLAPVARRKDWGYINEKGEVVVPMQYRDAEVYGDNGLAPVKEKKLWGFIDTTGKMVIPAQYDITAGGFSMFSKNNVKGFHDGVARVRYKKEWGYLNENGKPLGGKWYQNAELFSE